MADRYGSSNINIFDIEIDNGLMRSRVFWARIISSENQSLFTQNTKHTFYEIQYALEGRIGMTVGQGERIIFDESDFIVIPPDTFHQIVDGDTEGERFIMAFTFEPLSDTLQGAVERLRALLPHRETERMRELLSLMVGKDYSDTPLHKRQLCALIECFLTEIIEATEDASPHSKSDSERKKASSTVNEIIEFIHSRGGIGIGVGDLARIFNISQRHLNRLFVSATGESPKETINHEKMKRIEALVSTTSLSLSEISELCGFSDEYAMNKFFRRYTRLNLSDFRAISKKAESTH